MNANKKSESLKILIVEDEPITLVAHARMLDTLGCISHIAVNGKQALAMFSYEYHVVLLDIELPDINGLLIAASMRKSENNKRLQTCIIAVTSQLDNKLEEKYLAAGINAVIKKPVATQELCRILKRFFEYQQQINKPFLWASQ